MNCCVEDYESYNVIETYKGYDVPEYAGNLRFLLGLILAFVGLYIGILSNIQGHGLGLLMVIASPFVMFKDRK